MISKTLMLAILFISHALFASEVKVKMSLSPAGSFEASTTKVKGEVKKDGNKLTAESIWVKIEELKTGIDLRDEHFHKHLNFEKSPKITLNKVVAENGKGSGELTVNEVTNKIDFTYKNISDKKIEATFTVKPSAFKLKEAKYLEIGVDDEVEVVATMDI